MKLNRKNKKDIEYNSEEIFDRLISKLTSELQEQIDFRMALSIKIFNGMKAKGWNKSEFALQMKKNNSIISRWLSGTHNFESDTLFDIQNKLGIKLLDCEANEGDEIYTIYTNNTVNIFINTDSSQIISGNELDEYEGTVQYQVITRAPENCN